MAVTVFGGRGEAAGFAVPRAKWLISVPMLAWAVHLILVTLTAAITVAVTPDRDAKRPHFAGVGHYVVEPLAVWDGGWYDRIAREGYGRRQRTAAFWPLYPLILWFGHAVTGAPNLVVGVVLSNACFLAALLALFALVRRDYGEAVATRTVWLVALWPLSFFFSAVYTELLFLLLTVGAIALGRSGRWTGASLVAVLAALTRNSGILVLVPLGWMLLQERGLRLSGWWKEGVQLGVVAFAPLAFAWHLAHLWGDALLSVRVQSKWGRAPAWPWETLAAAFRQAGHVYGHAWSSCRHGIDLDALDDCRIALGITRSDAFSQQVAFVFVFGCLALLPFAIRRLRRRDGLYLVVGFVFPLLGPGTGNPLQSDARYYIVIFPMFVALAILLRRQVVFVAALAASTVALCGLLSLFAQAFFVA